MVWVAHTHQGAHAPCTSRALACPVPALFKTGKCRESSSWCVGTVDPQDVGRTEESVNLTNVGLTDVPTPTPISVITGWCLNVRFVLRSVEEVEVEWKVTWVDLKRLVSVNRQSDVG